MEHEIGLISVKSPRPKTESPGLSFYYRAAIRTQSHSISLPHRYKTLNAGCRYFNLFFCSFSCIYFYCKIVKFCDKLFWILFFFLTLCSCLWNQGPKMAKSKNHTAHNQSYKAHRNGIKKPRKHRHSSTKGVCINNTHLFFLLLFTDVVFRENYSLCSNLFETFSLLRVNLTNYHS